MKRILLVKASNPTRFNNLLTFPLGLMYLASFLRERKKDVEIKILDLRLYARRWEDVLKRVIQEFNPDIAGISALTIEELCMKRIAEIIKGLNNRCIVIAGGPHPSAYPVDTLKEQNIDFVVIGEGERIFVDLVECLFSGGKPEMVKGVAFRRDGEFLQNPPGEHIVDIDSLPVPAWDLIPAEEYFKKTSMSNYGIRRYANLFTSRSCPYRCIYCHNLFGKGFRGMSPERVIEEIKFLKKKYNIEEVEVIDDVFNFDRARALKIFEKSVETGMEVKYSFPNGLRGDRLDEELIMVMKKSKTVMITVAVESASERIQRLIKKHLDLEKTKKIIEIVDKHNILIRGFFMMGFPGETEEEMKKTIDYACNSALHIAMFYITIPFKGTELYNMVKDELEDKNYSYYDYEYVKSRFNLSPVEQNTLIELQALAYRRFYLNPWRWRRVLQVAPYKIDLIRYVPWVTKRLFLDRFPVTE